MGAQDLLYVNFWGLAGNGKSTLFRKVVEAFGEDAYVLRKDTTRKPRPGEIGNPEYRYVPWGQFTNRVDRKQYRYEPERILEGGEMNLTGVPKWKFLPEIPPGKLLVASIFPVDLRFPVPYTDRQIINILVFVYDIKKIEARLKKRSGTDKASFRFKMNLNKAWRKRTLEGHPPHYYHPRVFTHAVCNDGSIEETMEYLARIIPGLRERLQQQKRL